MAKKQVSVVAITPDKSNVLFQLAVDLVNQSSRNIFLTGKAGTGKTTFLKHIRNVCSKNMAVVAPTGVAAINAGGVTIHSFFQLPLSPFIPEAKGFSKTNDSTINRSSLIGRLRITTDKKKVLEQLELVIIDEISMVRCDTLDAIDTVLRFIRKRPNERFGGVQMLFIGDMFQLPPVIKDPEWKELSEFYSGPYFFNSVVIREDPPIYIEFDKIYRQSEETFIRLLNQVRNNELDSEGIKILASRYQPSFRRKDRDGYIILTTHNEMARVTNVTELGRLESPLFIYEAEIEGDFSSTAYPAEESLQLKAGAQVMFIKNDSDKSKRYFNGKIGIVTKLEKDKICVQCKDEPDEIELNKEKWENIRYTVNKTSRQMESELLGSFTQYPLRLAWAITIHKSQGLTFEKAIIDAGDAFAPGQVYVALSRCTNLNGIVLKSEIRPGRLFSDHRIVEFSRNGALSDQLQRELLSARKSYQEKLLLSVFDFRIALSNSKELMEYITQNAPSFNTETVAWIEELMEKIHTLQQTAIKFHIWIQSQFQQPVQPEENTVLQERTMKAATHFVYELKPIIELLEQSPSMTDSVLHAKEYNDTVREIFGELSAKRFMLQGFSGKFDVETWHERKKKFVLPPFTINAYAGAGQQRTVSPYPVLHQKLRKLRDSICAKKDIPIYIVAGSKTIDEMAMYLPQTLTELRKISGFGDAKIEQYGQQFLEVILEYCVINELSSLIHEKLPKREKKQSNNEKKTKVDTKAESFRLYKDGLSIPDVARMRSLTTQTIEDHLSYYVSIGEIKIEELVSREKLLIIEPAIKDFEGGAITPIKKRLGNDIGFGEIKLALAWREFKNSTPQQ